MGSASHKAMIQRNMLDNLSEKVEPGWGTEHKDEAADTWSKTQHGKYEVWTGALLHDTIPNGIMLPLIVDKAQHKNDAIVTA